MNCVLESGGRLYRVYTEDGGLCVYSESDDGNNWAAARVDPFAQTQLIGIRDAIANCAAELRKAEET